MRVELKNITKHFGSICANDDVSMRVEPGTVHGLLGENGAGKSTLMKVLSGFISADRGEIILDDNVVQMISPARAIDLGVGMLHQDPLDFPALSVLSNFLLGSHSGLVPDVGRARRELRQLADQFDFHLDPDVRVSDLSISEWQQLEIIRLLWLGVRVLILDEPTTAISAQQKAKLFGALRMMAEQGKTIIFVSHKLDEVEELSSQVTVLAAGKVTGVVVMPCPTNRLVQMMFGKTVALTKRQPAPLGEPVLQMDGVMVRDWRMEMKGLCLEVRAGEVIGLAGLEGSGQRLMLQACGGLERPLAGRVCIGGNDMKGKPYRSFLEAGVAYMAAGRLEEGLIAGLTLTEHVALAERSRSFLIDWNSTLRKTVGLIGEFNIKGDPAMRVEELSGGNQQRTLLALLPRHLKLLLLEHPTRGLDVESVESIWGLLLERTRLGTAIIFISSDLDELLDRCDRILVFFSGRVAPPFDARKVSVEQLGELIGGKGF